MSGDNLYGEQPLNFYSDEMTEIKKIAFTHFEKKLFPESKSIIHLQRKHQERKVSKQNGKHLLLHKWRRLLLYSTYNYV